VSPERQVLSDQGNHAQQLYFRLLFVSGNSASRRDAGNHPDFRILERKEVSN
jgi:hypothetical protein